MPQITWVTISKIWCGKLQDEAALMEQRYYFDEPIPDGGGPPFKVIARKCSYGVDCNLQGHACRWAHTNPNNDPFEQQGKVE